MKTCVAGIDIGYDCTTIAVVDLRGEIKDIDSFPTTAHPQVNDFIAHLSERLVSLFEKNGGYERIRSLGVSVPGGNFITGSIENTCNLPWSGNVPLAAILRDRVGMAAAVTNNSHARALGEYIFGSARGISDFILVTLGHGIGSTFFSKGEAHLGSEGFAGELGHCCMVEDGRACNCGQRGCLEAYCGHNGIIATARELMEQDAQPSLMRDVDELTPRSIKHCCDEGDALAIETYRRTGEMLGIALANYASLVNPEAIVVSGGLSRAGHWLIDPMEQSFEDHVFRNIRGKVKLLTSFLSDVERDVLGCSALAWTVKEYSLFK